LVRSQKTLKETRTKLSNTPALPALKYGSENCTIKLRHARRITAAEVKYMRKRAGCTWTDYKTNIEIAKEINITAVLERMQEYRRNWLQHTTESPAIDYREYCKNCKPTHRRKKTRRDH